jgi:hypothetical protein
MSEQSGNKWLGQGGRGGAREDEEVRRVRTVRCEMIARLCWRRKSEDCPAAAPATRGEDRGVALSSSWSVSGQSPAGVVKRAPEKGASWGRGRVHSLLGAGTLSVAKRE